MPARIDRRMKRVGDALCEDVANLVNCVDIVNLDPALLALLFDGVVSHDLL